MQPLSGYYSLVQYCPDLARLEAVNVGVLLFCPVINFVSVRVNGDNDRVAKVFGKDSFDPLSLDAAKRGLVYRVTKSEDKPKTREDLERFISARGDAVRLSAPRPLVTNDPHQEVNDLYERLVMKEVRRQPRPKRFYEALGKVFRALKRQGRAQTPGKIYIPVLGMSIKVPYAYRNGVENLVKPHTFSAVESTAEKAAMVLAVEGDLLTKHRADDGTERKLVVVADFAPSDNGKHLSDHVIDVLKEYNVETVRREQIPEFVAKVQREAH